MLLQPRKYRFSKMHKRAFKNNSNIQSSCFKNWLIFGSWGVYSKKAGYVSPKQLESIRQLFIACASKTRLFDFWVRVALNLGKTRKASESRMGKGRGKNSTWVICIQAGQVLFEFGSSSSFYLYYRDLKRMQSKVNISLGYYS